MGVPALETSQSEELESDDSEKAGILARQYCSLFASESASLPLFEDLCLCKLEDVHFDEFSVYEVLSNLDPYSSPGPDNIHPLILRNLAEFNRHSGV